VQSAPFPSPGGNNTLPEQARLLDEPDSYDPTSEPPDGQDLPICPDLGSLSGCRGLAGTDDGQKAQDMPAESDRPFLQDSPEPTAIAPDAAMYSPPSTPAMRADPKPATVGTQVSFEKRRRNAARSAGKAQAPMRSAVVKRTSTRISQRSPGASGEKPRAPYIFRCVWGGCEMIFNKPCNLFRHEESKHLQRSRWICAPNGPTEPLTGRCVYCQSTHGGPLSPDNLERLPDSVALNPDLPTCRAPKDLDQTMDCQSADVSLLQDGRCQPASMLGTGTNGRLSAVVHVSQDAAPPGQILQTLSGVPSPISSALEDTYAQFQIFPGLHDSLHEAQQPLTPEHTPQFPAATSPSQLSPGARGWRLDSPEPLQIPRLEADLRTEWKRQQSLAEVMTPVSLPSPGRPEPPKPPDYPAPPPPPPSPPCGRGCADKPEGARSFLRKDNFMQHLKHCHPHVRRDTAHTASWARDAPPPPASRCGFCGAQFTVWAQRKKHIAEEYAKGRKIADWKGDGLGFVNDGDGDEEVGGNRPDGCPI